MKKLKKRTKRNILLVICLAAAVLLVVLLIWGISRLTAKHIDTSEGIAYIKKAESADVTAIEDKISRLEKQESGEKTERSLKERFSRSVIVGDSIVQGFADYDILNASSVAAKVGVHLNETESLIEKTKEVNPQLVFLSLGNNDVSSTNGDIDLFTEEYGAFLDELQAAVPDAHIFVNSIFPVQSKVIREDASLAMIPEYNSALQELCDSRRIGFIDNTDLVEEKYYEQDGTHFKADFYPIWAENMAEVAAL